MTADPPKHGYAAADPARSHTAHVVRELGLGIIAGTYPPKPSCPAMPN